MLKFFTIPKLVCIAQATLAFNGVQVSIHPGDMKPMPTLEAIALLQNFTHIKERTREYKSHQIERQGYEASQYESDELQTLHAGSFLSSLA